MSNTLFKELIGDIPVSTVDVDTIIARQRRNRTVRFSIAGLSAIAVAAALTAGLAVIKTTGLENPAATPSPTPTAHPLQFIPAGAWETRWNWLSIELDRAVKDTVQGSQWFLAPFEGAVIGVDGDPPRFFSSDTELRTTWGLANGTDKGSLAVTLLYPTCADPAINGTPACRPECPVGGAGCREGLTAAGLRYVLYGDFTSGQSTRRRVDITLCNGVLLVISVGNEILISREQQAFTAHPPISAEQLLTVAETLSTKFAASPAP